MELSPKFKKPVFAGESILNRVRMQSKRLSSKPDRGIVATSHEVVTDKGEIAIAYQSTRMIRTRQFVEAEPGARWHFCAARSVRRCLDQTRSTRPLIPLNRQRR